MNNSISSPFDPPKMMSLPSSVIPSQSPFIITQNPSSFTTPVYSPFSSFMMQPQPPMVSFTPINYALLAAAMEAQQLQQQIDQLKKEAAMQALLQSEKMFIPDVVPLQQTLSLPSSTLIPPSFLLPSIVQHNLGTTKTVDDTSRASSTPGSSFPSLNIFTPSSVPIQESPPKTVLPLSFYVPQQKAVSEPSFSTCIASSSSIVPPSSSPPSTSQVQEVVLDESEEEYVNVDFVKDDDKTNRERRKAHIEFHRKVKSVVKRGINLECHLCKGTVDRHMNAITQHIVQHAEGAIRLICLACGIEKSCRMSMNNHIREKHPKSDERSYSDQRDHERLGKMLFECFPRGTRQKKDVKEGKEEDTVVAPVVNTVTTSRRKSAEEGEILGRCPRALSLEFTKIVTEFCEKVKKGGKHHVICRECNRGVTPKYISIQSHIRNQHSMFRCRQCRGGILESTEEARNHAMQVHNIQEGAILDHFSHTSTLDVMFKRFRSCFGPERKKEKSVDRQTCPESLVEEQPLLTSLVKVEPTVHPQVPMVDALVKNEVKEESL